MRPASRTLLIAGLAAGATGGAIAAVAIPQTTAGTSASASRPAVIPSAVDVRRVAAARPEPRGSSFIRLRAVGPRRIAVTVPDPRGGPPWAVREFLAERLAQSGPDLRGGPRVIGRNRCVQLGRLYRGRFGWMTADGTFRPIRVSLFHSRTQCLSRRSDTGGKPRAEIVTTVTEPHRSAAEAVQTIVFGLAGAASREPRLTVSGQPVPIGRGAVGTLLAVLPADTRGAQLGLTVRYARRGAVSVIPARQETDWLKGLPPEIRRRLLHPPMPVPGTAPQLTAEAPDPDGGLPLGMTAAPGTKGQVCTGFGRVIGDRVGSVDYELDLLLGDEGARGATCHPTWAEQRRDRSAAPPYDVATYGGDLGADPMLEPRTTRVARRSLPGRIIFSGVADRSVRYLTFETPSDVRTIAPTGPAHAFIVVYAGGFPTGKIFITTTFRDGSTRRDEQYNLGF